MIQVAVFTDDHPQGIEDYINGWLSQCDDDETKDIQLQVTEINGKPHYTVMIIYKSRARG